MDNIFILYGTNKFLINYNLKKITLDNDIENYNLDEIAIQDVLSFARELPMFSDKKYVVCDNAYFLSSTKNKIEHNIDDLIKYIDNPVKSTVLILILDCEKLDNRKKINTMLEKKAKIIECNEITDNDILKYTKELFKNNEKNISDDLARHLISRLNSNIDMLKNEVDKLCLLDEIKKEDIDLLVHENVDDNIFNFIDSIINNDKKKMFLIYENTVDSGLEPIQIIAMLAQEFRSIYQVRILSEKGYLDKDIMDILGIYKIGRIKFLKSKGRNISNARLLSELKKLGELDIKIKTGEIDKYIAFEHYLLNL